MSRVPKSSTIQNASPAEDPYFESLRSHRAALLELSNDQMRTFDKALLTLSSGAFGLSVLFIEKIGGTAHEGRGALVSSWVCFLLAMICNLFSYHSSSGAAHAEIKKIDDCLRNRVDYSSDKNFLRNLTRFFNYSALSLFIFGSMFLAYFAYANIRGE